MTAAKLRELLAKATQCNDVCVSWYSFKQPDGTYIHHPQFEADNGKIAQEEEDYELYAYLRNHAQDFIKLIEAAEKQHEGHGSYETCDVCKALAAFKEKS